MEKKDGLTKALAIAGTVLSWFPVLLPFVLALGPLIRARALRFDYFAPAEVFPVALVGACLLLWAALRARSRQTLIGWGLGIAVAALVASQALAIVTGLASGETGPVGVGWALVVAVYAIYPLALVLVAVGGALLLRDLFRRSQSQDVRT